jgi:murein tripeptide amidase MpaA
MLEKYVLFRLSAGVLADSVQWIGPSSAVYFLHSLLLAGTSDHDSEEAKLLQAFTFTVIPTINPDGYEYSREHRMWRKNRQNVGSDSCSGKLSEAPYTLAKVES